MWSYLAGNMNLKVFNCRFGFKILLLGLEGLDWFVLKTTKIYMIWTFHQHTPHTEELYPNAHLSLEVVLIFVWCHFQFEVVSIFEAVFTFGIIFIVKWSLFSWRFHLWGSFSFFNLSFFQRVSSFLRLFSFLRFSSFLRLFCFFR